MANEVFLDKQDFDKKIKLFYQQWDKVLAQYTHMADPSSCHFLLAHFWCPTLLQKHSEFFVKILYVN